MWIIRNVRDSRYAALVEGGVWGWTHNRLFAGRWDTKEAAYKIAMRFYSHDAFAIERY